MCRLRVVYLYLKILISLNLKMNLSKVLRVLFAFVLVLNASFGFGVVLAQQQVELDDEQGVNTRDLDVVLIHGEQDPATKEFDLIATITSNIDSDRVLVTWDLPGSVEFASTAQYVTEQTAVSAGESTIVRVRVVGGARGGQEFSTTVTLVKADVNYISSDNMEVVFNESREILPMTSDYKQARVLNNIKTALIFLCIGGVALGAGGAVYWRYRRVK